MICEKYGDQQQSVTPVLSIPDEETNDTHTDDLTNQVEYVGVILKLSINTVTLYYLIHEHHELFVWCEEDFGLWNVFRIVSLVKPHWGCRSSQLLNRMSDCNLDRLLFGLCN